MFIVSTRRLTLLAGLIFSSVSSGDGIDNTRLTWERARFDATYFPEVESCAIFSAKHSLSQCGADLAKYSVPAADRKAVLIWLTGCGGGLGGEMELFRAVNVVLVVPDTNARIGRSHQCSARTPENVVVMRQEEADYALEQLMKYQWVDKNRIFLGGHSEGGRATYRHSGKGFRARIIAGQDCDGGRRPYGTVPALNLKGENDEVLPFRGLCNLAGLENSWSVAVPGSGHSNIFNDVARDHVKKFLAQFK